MAVSGTTYALAPMNAMGRLKNITVNCLSTMMLASLFVITNLVGLMFIHAIMLWHQCLSNPAGGQASRRIPKVKPRDASTSLISLSDLRPKLGVFNSSFSVR